MEEFELKINGKLHPVKVEPKKPLLWILRDDLGLTGTKYGCGIAQCGACTVHLDGIAVRSCVLLVNTIGKREITTIEGLSQDGNHPVQQAWEKENVPQCGYCQSGQVMSAVSLIKQNPNPTDQDIERAMSGNICRCGTYYRIRKAIKGLKGL